MKDKIKQLLFKNGKFISSRNEKWLSLNYPELYEWLMLQFNDYEEYSQKARAVYNGDYCRCAECNGIMLYPNDRSRKYCSAECSSKAKSRKLSDSHDGSRIQKMRDTMVERYGVDNASRIPNISRKPIDYSARLEKARMTSLERYGGWPMQNSGVKEKAIASNIRKYGAAHRLCNAEQYTLHLETMMEKHGVQYAMQDSKLKEKNMISKFRNVIDTSECNTYEDAKRRYLESIGVYLTDVPFAVGTPATRMMPATVARMFAGQKEFNWQVIKNSYSDYHGMARKLGVRAADTSGSVAQLELLAFVQSMAECQTNVRNIIPPLELDIYIPDHKLAIEFNGLYWHDYFRTGDKFYHMRKTELCRRNGIQLLHIWEDDWMFNRPIVESIIRERLGINQEIDAEVCKVEKVGDRTARKFYTENHLHGYRYGAYHYSLVYDGDTVMMASFSFHEDVCELVRIATKCGITVNGGMAKLLTHMKTTHNSSKFITHVCLDTSNGSEYMCAGFVAKGKPIAAFWDVNKKTGVRTYPNKMKNKDVLEFNQKSDKNSQKKDKNYLTECHFRLYNAGNLTMETEDV